MGDTAPALISLDAKVKIMSRDKNRIIPLEKIFSGDGQTPLTLSPTEIIEVILIPGSDALRGTAFVKFTLRGGLEFAVLSVAAVLDVEDDGETCCRARITVGALSAAPIRARKAESSIEGKGLSAQPISVAVHAALDEIHPTPHHGHSSEFLRECLRVQTEHALRVSTGRVKG
jgi:CO/xanthine dehydrogenase FAD-binding subunit